MHHPIPDDLIRLHQIEAAVCWINDSIKGEEDLVIITGDYNASPESETYKHLISEGFTSSYAFINGREPEKTFPTGLIAPHMDTDPALTVDFIFFRIGTSGKHIKVLSSVRLGEKPHPEDPTIYGSDHYPIVTEFEIFP